MLRPLEMRARWSLRWKTLISRRLPRSVTLLPETRRESAARHLRHRARGFSGARPALQLSADAALCSVSRIRRGHRTDCRAIGGVSWDLSLRVDRRADCNHHHMLYLSD